MALTKPIAYRLEENQKEDLEILAFKLGTNESDVLRRFLAAGLAVNPITEEERASWRRKKKQEAGGALPGLVVPINPIVAKEEKSGGENGTLRHGRDSDLIASPKRLSKHLQAA